MDYVVFSVLQVIHQRDREYFRKVLGNVNLLLVCNYALADKTFQINAAL